MLFLFCFLRFVTCICYVSIQRCQLSGGGFGITHGFQLYMLDGRESTICQLFAGVVCSCGVSRPSFLLPTSQFSPPFCVADPPHQVEIPSGWPQVPGKRLGSGREAGPLPRSPWFCFRLGFARGQTFPGYTNYNMITIPPSRVAFVLTMSKNPGLPPPPPPQNVAAKFTKSFAP